MIDRRNISYTQGDYRTPIESGSIVESDVDPITLDIYKSKTSNIPTGTTVSRSPGSSDTVGAGIPTSVINFFEKGYTLWGLTTAWDFWMLAAGTPEQKLDAIKNYVPVDEAGKDILDDVSDKIADQPNNEWYYQPSITVPGAEPFQFNFPDIRGGLKWVGIGILAIGAMYVAGKYLGRSKK